jgi:poly(3-hydroxybutyrate) depolymerase
VGTGGSSASGGTTSKPGTGGATASGGKSGPAGGSTAGGAVGSGGHLGSGGSSASGGTTSQPGTGGATATGGNPGLDGGSGTGGAIDAGGTSPAGQSAGCGKTSTITSSQYNNGNPISITVNGSQRRYILSVPTNYDNTKPYKFVLSIHARDSNDKSEYNEKYYGLQPLSNNTTIFAAPNGVNGSTPCSGTGVGDSNCGWPSGNNNMELMDAVVKQVTDNFCVDTNRIFATGWSYGASMSYEIACQRPLGGPTATASWGVRAIAVYAAAEMSGSCKPSAANPVAYYASHGTHDSVLCYDSSSSGCSVGGVGGVGLAQNWATADGCTWQTPTKVTSGNHACTKLAGCKSGYPVEFCSFNGDHTAYPDNCTESSSWGPQEVWTFLSQF